MANLSFYPILARSREIKLISGNIPLNSSAAVGTTVGRGFTVAKTATGQYTVTLEKPFNALVGAGFVVQTTGAWVLEAVLGTLSVGTTTSTIIIRTISTSGIDTDTAVAGTIYFNLALGNSNKL